MIKKRKCFIFILINTFISYRSLCEFAFAQQISATKIFGQQGAVSSPRSPKESLRDIGVNPEIWVTQFFQGIVSGDSAGISRYGGKFDGFLTLTPEKLHVFRGLQIDAQYEHYFGLNVNPYSNTGLPVNTAQAYLQRDLYHSTLSLTITQKFNENLSITAGKFNMMSLASQTPLVGGGGINSFMNRAFAIPSTGVSYTSVKGGPEDRVESWLRLFGQLPADFKWISAGVC